MKGGFSIKTKEVTVYPLYKDLMFKYIFGTKENIIFTKSLLEEIFHLEKGSLKGLKVVNSVPLLPENILKKNFDMDILIKMPNGSYVNLEMYTAFDREEKIKSLMYMTRTFASELKKGEKYNKVVEVKQINFIKRERKSSQQFLSKNSLADEERPEVRYLPDLFNQEIIELDNIPEKYYNECRWLRLIRAKTYAKMKEIAKGDDIMSKAVEKMVSFSGIGTVAQYFEQDIVQKSKTDRRVKEAKSEGRVEGRAEGRVEGIRNATVDIARNMFNLNLDKKTISKATGLSIDELENIKVA